jgi:hypothetical protein
MRSITIVCWCRFLPQVANPTDTKTDTGKGRYLTGLLALEDDNRRLKDALSKKAQIEGPRTATTRDEHSRLLLAAIEEGANFCGRLFRVRPGRHGIATWLSRGNPVINRSPLLDRVLSFKAHLKLQIALRTATFHGLQHVVLKALFRREGPSKLRFFFRSPSFVPLFISDRFF